MNIAGWNQAQISGIVMANGEADVMQYARQHNNFTETHGGDLDKALCSLTRLDIPQAGIWTLTHLFMCPNTSNHLLVWDELSDKSIE